MKDDSEQGAWEALLSAQSHTRIVACVNGCKGINPDAIPVMLEVLEYTADMLQGGGRPEYCEPWAQEIIRMARAAIAKAKK